MKRKRHNYFENRYNQFVLAGKIAVKTGVINPYEENGKLISIYRRNEEIDYSSIGQDYLRQLGINIVELI